MASYLIKTKKHRKPQGPFSGSQLQQLVRLGKLLPTHFVSPDNGKTWHVAKRFSSLDFQVASPESLSVKKMAPDTCIRLTKKLAKQAGHWATEDHPSNSTSAKHQPQPPIQSFRLTDDTIYQWNIVLRNEDRNSAWQNKVQYLKTLATTWIPVICSMTILTYFVFWLVGLLSTTIAYWIALYVIGAVIFGVVSDLVVPDGRADREIKVMAFQPFLFASLLYLLSAPESSLAEGFLGAEGAGLWAWMLFFFDNVLSVIFFDIPELVFGYRFSAITGDSPSSRAVVVLIRVSVVIGIVKWFMSACRSPEHETKTESFLGSVMAAATYLRMVTRSTSSFDFDSIGLIGLAYKNASEVAEKQHAFDKANQAHLTDVSDESNRETLKEAKKALASAKQTTSGMRIECQGAAISFSNAVHIPDRELSDLNNEEKRNKKDMQRMRILFAPQTVTVKTGLPLFSMTRTELWGVSPDPQGT